jgi:hypothetical protein
MERPKRGKTVAGISARRQRTIRRQNRGEAQRTRRSGMVAPEEAVTAADDLEAVARRLRGLPPAENLDDQPTEESR